jgi:tRNA threonylcarbamoyl adenosine modification protein YeaZ
MVLCIDTATDISGVALIVSDKNKFYEELKINHTSDGILEKIDIVLHKAKSDLSSLKAVMVISGPGSFTGLRVGIAVANQFSHQLKIPISGIRTDELYSCRTDEKDFIYLQSMNREQVYIVGYGRFKINYPQSIISISECHSEIMSEPDIKWLGQLNDKHLEAFSDIPQISDLLSPETAWMKVAQNMMVESKKIYDLVMPYYGKEPTITKSNKAVSL